jgi:hypothetical protein
MGSLPRRSAVAPVVFSGKFLERCPQRLAGGVLAVANFFDKIEN